MAHLRPTTVFIALLAAGLPAAANADAISDFYTGKTINILVGADPGGGYDAQARLVSRHIGRFIPGNPGTIVQNVPGAGGILVANRIYNVAPQDGTYMAVIQRGILTSQLTGQPGVRYDVAKFHWLGNMASEAAVVVSWHDSPIKTTQDIFNKEFIVAGTGVTGDNEMSARLLTALIGAKMKIVAGYRGTTDAILAMERGEVMGLADWAWSNVKERRGEFLRDHKINVLMQSALEKEPDLPDVPLALDYVKNDTDREAMELFFAQKTIARPVMVGPGVSDARVAALRDAFDRMTKDEQFKRDAEKSKLEVEATDYKSVDKLVALINSTPPAVAKRLADATTPH
ncbi:MAG TPA: tripartite tricarboxylate transporter substrate-binding protein [Alphaproteobacteria bacterium]|nr:tripartite tricarboxylate transporter substrate-binding protein [Alphaproteobacteria bacterium]